MNPPPKPQGYNLFTIVAILIISVVMLLSLAVVVSSYNSKTAGPNSSFDPLPGTPGVSRAIAPSSPHLSAEERTLINDWVAKDYLRIEAEWHKAYVASVLWLNIDAQRKETLVSLLATDGAEKRGHDLRNIELFDKQSGRKIASYSIWTGVKLE